MVIVICYYQRNNRVKNVPFRGNKTRYRVKGLKTGTTLVFSHQAFQPYEVFPTFFNLLDNPPLVEVVEHSAHG
jgi:hypothetical protein